jgi:adenine phosphoribosyltransferase
VSAPEGLARLIRDVPDFPEPGIVYKDITPLLGDGAAFRAAIDGLAVRVASAGIAVDRIAGIEARGFIVGAALAARIGVGFAPVRKPGKLPWETVGAEYALEYGTDRLEIHRDAVLPGQDVLIVDDVIATGGTAATAAHLVESLGARVSGFAFLVEIEALPGRVAVAPHPTVALLTL